MWKYFRWVSHIRAVNRRSDKKRETASLRAGRFAFASNHVLLGFGEFVRLLQPLAGFVDRSLSVVVGLHCEPVLVHCPVTLAGDVEDFAQRYVAPDLGPARLTIAAKRVAVRIDAGLVIALGEEQLANAIGGEGTLRVGIQSLLVFGQSAGQVVLRHQLLAF